MSPHWACSPSRKPHSTHRPMTELMKSITYLLTAFSCGYTAQCLAGLAGLLPGPFFLLGFAGAIYGLSQSFSRHR